MSVVLPQRKLREIVFQMVYSRDFNESGIEEISPLFDQLMVAKSALCRAFDKMCAIVERIERIDHLIATFSRDYDIARISRVEKNILRMSLFELLYEPHLPHKVIFSEAVRLSRKFGTPEGGAFVNAVLDAIYRAKAGESLKNKRCEIGP